LKKKPVLKQKTVRRKKENSDFSVWRVVTLATSSLLKFTCLLIGLIIISFIFLGMYQYLLTSPHIKLEKIIFKGVDEKFEGELFEMAQLRYDLSLFAIHLSDLKQKMEKHPWIKSVQLEKRFPHTLVIDVEKQSPYAVVLIGDLFYMDPFGKIFKRVDPNEGIDYPLITGISDDENLRETELKLAAQVLNSLNSDQGVFSYNNISEIHVKDSERVSLYFLSLPVAITVKGAELPAKLGELKKVIEHLSGTGRIHMVKGINLEYGDAAVISFWDAKLPKAPKMS